MKKSFYLFLAMLFALLTSHAQVVIQLQVPPLGLCIKPQLWNLALMNGTKDPLTVRIQTVITDVASNQQVLSGTTRAFLLPSGAKQVQVKDVQPITYSSGSSLYAIDPSPDGFLPIGIFNICYTLISTQKVGAEEPLAETCETFEIEPLSPPMLVLPGNNDFAETTRPFFNWLPPSPYQLFANLRYDFTLVELFPTQSAADAVQQNIPVAAQGNITLNTYQYPLTLPELDSSKTYAWRIVAKNGMMPVGNSETWTFKVKRYGIDSSASQSRGYFTKLRREDDASYVIAGDKLRFSYEHETSDSSVAIKLTDITGAVRKEVALDDNAMKVKYGQNFISFDLQPLSVVNKHIYTLELINARNEKWYIKFEYRKP